MAYYSNKYSHEVIAANKNDHVSGANWNGDITINEMMTFWGILIKMTLRPMPGQPYEAAWRDPAWHPYTQYVRLRRFQKIRSVLHVNDNSNMHGSRDSLVKVRPLLNTVKVTFAKYLNIGSEVALDEASVASRSKYGGFSIFYNPTKPGGKYHFRFYMLCCATTYACFHLRMHTRDVSDSASGFVPVAQRPLTAKLIHDEDSTDSREEEDSDEDKEEVPEQSRMMSLVVDMCRALEGSGQVVNMDNYYTSPEIAVKLRSMDIFIRGTVRKDRFGFPPGVCFTKAEARKLGHGATKTMVYIDNGLVAHGWCEGNPVHLLSSADECAVSSVSQRVNSKRTVVSAPSALGRYNQHMHTVDRHDQLHQLLLLSSRHGFKKYYIKIMLGIVDMALVNAFILYKITDPTKCESSTAQYEFMDAVGDAMLSNDWDNFSISNLGSANDAIFEELIEKDAGQHAESAGRRKDLAYGRNTDCDECVHKSVSGMLAKRSQKKGFACQICRFEGRGDSILKDVCWCWKHAIRCCSVARSNKELTKVDGTPMTDYTWCCNDEAMTCWRKAHCFYIPNGLFDDVHVPQQNLLEPRFQHVRLGSVLYQKKRSAVGKVPFVKRKRKLQNSEATLVSKEATSVVQSKRGRPQNSASKKSSPPKRSSTRILFKQKRQNRLDRIAKMQTRAALLEDVSQSSWV